MRTRLVTGLGLAALALAGCGSSDSTPTGFAWLRPAPPPPAWRTARLPDGSATLAYPASWRRIGSDPGTVTAGLHDRSGGLVGYLNATPQQGAETFENWADFRIEHNGEEGDRQVRTLASAQHLRFRGGAVGSCVIDRYATESGHPYREIACLVGSAKATTVVVAAAPPSAWRRQGGVLERAVSAFST
jgi:hypothetical protein